MKRLFGALLGLGAGAALLAAVRGRARRSDDSAPADPSAGAPAAKERTDMHGGNVGQNVERVQGGDRPPATGRAEEPDALGAAHGLTHDAAQQARWQRRLERGGKATSREREGMFGDAVPGGDVGVSGSQADEIGQQDRNPIGPQK